MKTITFEDHGQDFLTFKVKNDGTIVDVQPFQFSIWSKYRVENIKELSINGFVKLVNKSGRLTIKYPIISIS